jgi:hypothetical protein
MKYIDTINERKSDSNESLSSHKPATRHGNVKRLLLLFLIAVCLAFTGSQSMQTIKASQGACDLVCGKPFIDPSSGRCVRKCCPASDECMRPCIFVPCED